jgi:FlaA1/EpsC-like NDP-sugar epimerase
MELFWATMPILLVLRLATFAYFRLFEGWWRHVGMQDLADLFKAVTLSSLLFLGVLFVVGDYRELPRSVLVLDWLLAMGVFGGLRFAVRGVREGRLMRRRSGGSGRRTLIIGAGEAAKRCCVSCCGRRHGPLPPDRAGGRRPDEAGDAAARRAGGGRCRRMIGDLVKRHGIQLLVIALPSATRDQMQRIVGELHGDRRRVQDRAAAGGAAGRPRAAEQLRTWTSRTCWAERGAIWTLKQVEGICAGDGADVTGGAGSIGSELARQIARSGRRMILVDRRRARSTSSTWSCAGASRSWSRPGDRRHHDTRRASSRCSRSTARPRVPRGGLQARAADGGNVVEAVRNNVLGTLCGRGAAQHGVGASC